MKKQMKKKKNSVKRLPRVLLVGILVATAVFGAATVVSMQRTKVMAARGQRAESPLPNLAANKAGKNYTGKLHGQEVKVDSQTGDMRPLTQQEAERLAAGLEPLLNQSTEGLVQVQHADGSVSMDLQGHFQDVAVARMNQDGSISQSCVNNPRAAGAFFGIDPKLLADKENETSKQPSRIAPARNQAQ
jgi:hypothetical protein